jgi:hypothetical protein
MIFRNHLLLWLSIAQEGKTEFCHMNLDNTAEYGWVWVWNEYNNQTHSLGQLRREVFYYEVDLRSLLKFENMTTVFFS